MEEEANEGHYWRESRKGERRVEKRNPSVSSSRRHHAVRAPRATVPSGFKHLAVHPVHTNRPHLARSPGKFGRLAHRGPPWLPRRRGRRRWSRGRACQRGGCRGGGRCCCAAAAEPWRERGQQEGQAPGRPSAPAAACSRRRRPASRENSIVSGFSSNSWPSPRLSRRASVARVGTRRRSTSRHCWRATAPRGCGYGVAGEGRLTRAAKELALKTDMSCSK